MSNYQFQVVKEQCEMMRSEGLVPEYLFEDINPEQRELFSKLS